MKKRNRKYTIEEVREVFSKENCQLLSEEYLNNKQKLRFIAQCGHETTARLNDFILGKSRLCNECTIISRAEKKKYSYEEVSKFFKDRKCKLLSKEYKNQRCRLDYIASCGHAHHITLKNFLKGCGNVCTMCAKGGENSPRYKPEKTDEERLNDRSHEMYRKWRIIVFERDKYTCQKCLDDRGGNLECHHIDSHNWAIESRFDIENGITLCEKCHKDFHLKYGFGDNTREQFNEWF